MFVNTANTELLVAVKIGDHCFSVHNEFPKRHNEEMLPLISKLLRQHNLKIGDIDEFGVVVGPGSFTGIRVGISTVKAFRDALNVKGKGINNLDLLFALATKQNKDVDTVAILGSRDSYFVAKKINHVVYKYERNLTCEELKNIAENKLIGMYEADENLNSFVVNIDLETCFETMNKSNDEKLVPVYYQLSQAENEKLKRGEIKIVSASVKDLDDIVRIEASSITSNAMTYNTIKSKFENGNYKFLVLKFNSVIVGYVIVSILDEINIDSIAVEKTYRNLGLATKLIEKVIRYAKRQKKDVSLEVSDKNISAYLLYKKLGFKSRRTRKRYYDDGTDAIEMVRPYK